MATVRFVPKTGEIINDCLIPLPNMAKCRAVNNETLIRFPGEPGSYWRVYKNEKSGEVRYIPVDEKVAVPVIDDVKIGV